MKTQVCITVDIEFSIAGAFAAPDRYSPLADEPVECLVDGKEQGLGFILDSLARYDASATFFTETLQTAYFGDAPMAKFAKRIANAGHDIQLHLHPCWLHFRDENWRLAGFQPNDFCSGKTDAELDEMIRLGIEAFSRWGVERPVALRTGGFRTDRAVYRAMMRAGLDLASNIGLAVFEPEDQALRLWGGHHDIDGVLEVPVLAYRTPGWGLRKHNWRQLAITATSQGEMEALLRASRLNRAPSVVILTHPFEFVRQKGVRYERLQINHVNQARFLHVLEFLQRNSDDFEIVTFGGRRRDWCQAGTIQTSPLQTPAHLAILRSVQNKLNDFAS